MSSGRKIGLHRSAGKATRFGGCIPQIWGFTTAIPNDPKIVCKLPIDFLIFLCIIILIHQKLMNIPSLALLSISIILVLVLVDQNPFPVGPAKRTIKSK